MRSIAGNFFYPTRITPGSQKRLWSLLMAEGLTNCEIAGNLGINWQVVRNHLGMIYDKIGVSSRVELALGTKLVCIKEKLPWRPFAETVSSTF